jgi:hypothetical protein
MRLGPFVAVLALGAMATAFAAAPQPAAVDFVRDVQPIFRQHCYACHGPVTHQMGLRLDRRADAMRGGSIAVIGPGNAAASRLYLRVAGRTAGPQMPPTVALTPSQIDTIKRWLDEGAEWPDTAAGDGAPAPIAPILTAVAAGDLTKVRSLLDAGADVNVRSDEGLTPLLVATGMRGASPMVRLLLEHGGDAKADALGWTTLLRAAVAGDADVQRLLIAAGETRAVGAAIGLTLRAGCRTCAEFLAGHLTADTIPNGMFVLSQPFSDGSLVPAFLALAKTHGVPTDSAVAPPPPSAAGPPDEDVHSAARPESARQAIERALPLLQTADVTFMKKTGCVSCHHNSVTAMAVSMARTHGVRVDEETAQSQADAIGRYLESWRPRVSLGFGIPGNQDTVSYLLLGLSAEGFGATAATDTMARFLLRTQNDDGHWQSDAHRPPIESSEIEVTAVSLRALQVYAPHGDAAYPAAMKAAAMWLASARPRSTEDQAFQLLGLAWARAGKSPMAKAVQALRGEQRPDGGWAQLPSLGSDAYATGQALVALEESSAVTPSDPAYRRGVDFLLKTQLADGSWHVHTRARPVQPYFESDFPHRRDQFISTAATAWATIALAATLH